MFALLLFLTFRLEESFICCMFFLLITQTLFLYGFCNSFSNDWLNQCFAQLMFNKGIKFKLCFYFFIDVLLNMYAYQLLIIVVKTILFFFSVFLYFFFIVPSINCFRNPPCFSMSLKSAKPFSAN